MNINCPGQEEELTIMSGLSNESLILILVDIKSTSKIVVVDNREQLSIKLTNLILADQVFGEMINVRNQASLLKECDLVYFGKLVKDAINALESSLERIEDLDEESERCSRFEIPPKKRLYH